MAAYWQLEEERVGWSCSCRLDPPMEAKRLRGHRHYLPATASKPLPTTASSSLLLLTTICSLQIVVGSRRLLLAVVGSGMPVVVGSCR